jgi:lipoyl-dependent peroxiredoxin
MAGVERTATATWGGDLTSGSGRIESVGSGALSGLDVTWASRSEPSESGRTSPEELIAAAHAACFSMALSHGLAQAGSPPERLQVTATSTFVPGTGITAMRLDVTGRVPGLDENGFREAAEGAKENCPVSQALKGNVEISLEASLES